MRQRLPPGHGHDLGLHDGLAARPALNVQAERLVTTAPDSWVVLPQTVIVSFKSYE